MADICLWTKAWRSGAGWVAQGLAQGIAEAGGQIVFIAPLAEPVAREPAHANLRRVMLQRERVDAQSTKMERFLSSADRIRGAFVSLIAERRRTRAFVVSIPDPFVFSLPLLALLRLSGARILLIVHDAQPHVWRFGARFRRLERASYVAMYAVATTLVALTPQIKEALQTDFSIDPKKVRVIPHGAFKLSNVTQIPGSGRLLQFGTIRRNKSVLEAIRGVVLARREDAGVRMLVVGQPHAQELDYWRECQAAMAEDPSGFDVTASFVADEDLPLLISSVDAFVLAYKNFDSQSGVGVLAAVNGRPVIASRTGGLNELFDDGMRGEVVEQPITPETVADAIRRFRARPLADLRAETESGARLLREKLSWVQIGRTFLDVARENG